MTLIPLHLRERLGALTLLALLLAVLTGVSLSQAGLLDRQADTLEDVTLPALRRVHDLQRLVDAARGLEAMHLLADSDADRQDIEQQLARQRLQIQGRLVVVARHGADAGDRELHEQVQSRLQRYWQLQDRVLAASRSGAADPQQRLDARALLAGDSQAAWRDLGQSLGAWLALQEKRAAELSRASRSQAQWLRLGTAGVLGAVMLLSVAAALRLRSAADARPAAFVATRPAGDADRLPSVLDDIATQSRLVALNAAVQAARRGEPSESDLAERARLAAEAEALALRCDAARHGVRTGLPQRRERPNVA